VSLRVAEATPADLRDGDHRALPATRDVGRGGFDRDVPGGRLSTPGRGHHSSLVGHAGQLRHGEPAEPEDLRPARGLAEATHHRRAPLRLPGRGGAQAQLGRRGPERVAAGGDRRVGRGLPRDPGHRRRGQGGPQGLVRLPRPPQAARPAWRASSSSSRMPAWAWSRVLPSTSPRPGGSAAWFIGIATSSATCRARRCGR
jgi:hypothetical protein